MTTRSRTLMATAFALTFATACDGGEAARISEDGGPSAPVRPDAHNEARRDAAVGDVVTRNEAAADAVRPATVDAGHAPDAWTFAPTIAVASLDQNNTSACGSDAGACSAAWDATKSIKYGTESSYPGVTRTVDGFWDNAVAPGASSPASPYGHVSKVPVKTLLPGYDVPVFLASMNWWGSSGHIDNGEASSSLAQAENQVADQISRGFAGQVIAWDGTGRTEDKATQNIMASAEASNGAYKFALRLEENYFGYDCPGAEGVNVTCLNKGIAYIASHYASSPAYLKDTDGSGRPLLFFFFSDRSHYSLLTDPGIDPSGMGFVMLNPHGLPPTGNVVGEFNWVAPSDDGDTTTRGDAGSFGWCTDFGFSEAHNFFSAAASQSSAYLVSAAYKGFDDNLATWSLNRNIDQRCGMTWLETFNHTGTYGGSSYESTLSFLQAGHHLDMVMVDTWDDYEEGTELETGVDNCMSSLDVTLAGSSLRWTPSWGQDPMDGAVTGSEATVFKYAVFVGSPGGTDLMWVDDEVCANGTCPHALDVSSLGLRGGPYVFYVQAVGQPSIVNHVAGPTLASYSAP